jgi:hypothetical protein
MRVRFVAGLVALLGLAAALVPAFGQTTPPAAPAASSANTLQPVAAFAGIADPRARSIALFEEAGKVLTHARCVNCHPASERPLQTDRMRPHRPLVVRGADRTPAPGTQAEFGALMRAWADAGAHCPP